jgi:hypothetical protein
MASFNSDVVILVNPRIQQSPNNDTHDNHDNDNVNEVVSNDITDNKFIIQQLRQELNEHKELMIERFNNISNHQQHHLDILANMATKMLTLNKSMQSIQSYLLQSLHRSWCRSCCRSKVAKCCWSVRQTNSCYGIILHSIVS